MKKERYSDIPAKPIRFALYATRPHLRWALLALFFMVIGSTLATSIAFFFRHIVDSATAFTNGEATMATVVFWVIAFLVVASSEPFIWRLSGFTGMRWVTGFRATGQEALFTYLTSHSSLFFANRFAGSIVSKIGNAVNGMARTIEAFLWNYLPTFLRFAISTVLAWLASPLLALVFIFWIIVIVPINVYLATRISRLSTQVANQGSKLRGIMVDVFSNIGAVHQFARRSEEHAFVGEEIRKLRLLDLRSWSASEWQLVSTTSRCRIPREHHRCLILPLAVGFDHAWGIHHGIDARDNLGRGDHFPRRVHEGFRQSLRGSEGRS